MSVKNVNSDSDQSRFKMDRINYDKQEDDEVYLTQNENKPYEFLNSFDLIYSEISYRIKNSLNEKLNRIETNHETQRKDIMSLMVLAYHCKRELDTMYSDSTKTNLGYVNNDFNKIDNYNKNNLITQQDSSNNIENTICTHNCLSINQVKNITPSHKFSYSTENNSKNSQEKVSIHSKETEANGKCRVSVLDDINNNIKKSENNAVAFNFNNNYYKSFFTNSIVQSQSQSQSKSHSISSRDKNSRQNSFNNNMKSLQKNILMNSKNSDGNKTLNIIQTIKKNKSKNSINSNNKYYGKEEGVIINNLNHNENKLEQENENLPFSYKKRKPPSEGNFSNSNTSSNSKQTRNNSDKIENLFMKMNANKNSNSNLNTNINTNMRSKIQNTFKNEKIEKFQKIEKLTTGLRSSYTPIIHKESKIDRKPTKIIKKLFFEKKALNTSKEDKEKIPTSTYTKEGQFIILNNNNQNKNLNKEINNIEHIQIDLFGSSSVSLSKSNTQSNFKQFFTQRKNENIIIKLFDYCKSYTEKIRIKNITKLTRSKFFDYEIKNLENLIEYKKREENPLNRIEITNKDIFSKKLVLSEIFEDHKNKIGFKNFLLLIHSVLIKEEDNLDSLFLFHNLDENDMKIKINQIESCLNLNDSNIYLKYKEIIKNLKNRKNLYDKLKKLRRDANGKFLIDIIQFLENESSVTKKVKNFDLDVFLELFQSINILLDEDTKLNFELVIDIEILTHRKELLINYRENI